MGITQIYDFDNVNNFTLSNAVLSAGKAKLGLVSNPGQVFSQDFASATGFTYDALKASFTGGLVRQNSQISTNMLLGVTFTQNINTNWVQTGTELIGSLIGVPTISNGKLDCTVGTKGVYWESTEIGNIAGIFSVRFKYTPNYSGAPSALTALFSLKNNSNNNDKFIVYHDPTSGRVRLQAYDNAGNLIHSGAIFGNWLPTLGVEYELEICANTSGTGIIGFFINGVKLGDSPATVYIRGTSATRFYIASDGSYVSNALFDDVLLYNITHYTANYTPGYTVPEYKYLTSLIVGPSFTYTGIGTIQSVDSGTVIEAGAPRYIIAGKYWNGLAWVTSNNSYAQANLFATILANLTSFVASGGVVPWAIVFPDSNTLSTVSDLSVTVTGQRYSPTGYVEPAQALQVKTLLSYSQDHTEGANTDVRVVLKIDGVLKYWNGSAWVTSNGTIAQANTATEINTNLASLSLGVNSSVYVRWLLATSANTETPEIESATVVYDFGAIETPLVTCIIFGYLKNISDTPIADAIIRFELESKPDIYKEANNNVIHTGKVEVTTDANGYFALPLVRSSEFEDTTRYKISIIKNGTIAKSSTGSKLYFSVPDADTKDITDLLPTV